MPDPFDLHQPELDSPAEGAFLVTGNDSADLAIFTRYISFAVAGAIKVTTLRGEEVTIPSGSLAIGQMHRLRVKRVWSTGTTATGIVGYY